MHNKLWLALSAFLIAFASAVSAEDPVIYSRDVVRILPTAIVTETPIKDSEKKPETTQPPVAEEKIEKAKPLERMIKEVEVNIRPESFLKQPGVFNLQPFSDAAGLLVVLDQPRTDALLPNNIYTAVDVLFLATDGKILQIAPSITPSDLDAPITSQGDTRALLFLQSGQSAKQDILPGDQAEHSLFKTKPEVLTPNMPQS